MLSPRYRELRPVTIQSPIQQEKVISTASYCYLNKYSKLLKLKTKSTELQGSGILNDRSIGNDFRFSFQRNFTT